ncbi:MAG TPA: VWA domain-containing protein, partial [Planctomycetes bacterium]|nr:VWA domain-containing protein [Planctomycetota bacterium]
MGLLSPLFMLGLLGVSLPILFHLIRRTPKGQMLFSTLMFLQPSPPRITRRSRLENLLLLLLRAAVLALLAAAFSRPFLRQVARLDMGESFQRRVAIVVDGSASMQQPGVWQKVRQTVNDVVAGLESGDHPALFVFDEKLTTLHGFSDPMEFDTDVQQQAVLEAMRAAAPSWRATNIGEALVQAADILTAVSEGDTEDSAQQIVLITDLQKGASLDALQATPFPERVQVDVRIVSYRPGANASLQVLRETEPQTFYRTRLVNGEESGVEQFSLHWLD